MSKKKNKALVSLASTKHTQPNLDKSMLTSTMYQLMNTAFYEYDTIHSDELLQQTGKSRQELLNIVMADDEILSCREDIISSILAQKWRIWGKDVDEEIINQFYIMLRKLAHDFANLVLLARFNGYAVAEYVFKPTANGLLILDKLLSKDGELEYFHPKRDGKLIFHSLTGDVEVNQDIKFLLLTNNAVPARPYGEMTIIRAYPAVMLRKRGWSYAGQFIARYAQPYVVGKQGGYSDLNQFTQTIYGFLNGGAAGIGQDDHIDIHQLSGNGEAFEKIENMANARIQKLLLGRVKNSELAIGSRSAQETDDKVREHRIRGYLDLMAQGVQHAINAIITVNQYYGVPIHAPQGIWFDYEEQTQVDVERANRDKLYCDTGQVRLTKDYLVNIVGFEAQHIEMVEPAPPQPSIPLSMQLSQPAHDHTQHDPQQHQHNDDEDDTTINTQAMQAKLNAIFKSLQQAKSYAEFEQQLNRLTLPDAGLIEDLALQTTQQYIKGLAGLNAD